MKLNVILPPVPEQQYECQRCTRGCRELVVFLTKRDKEKIDRQEWKSRMDETPYLRLHGGYVLNHRADGACVFLQPDGLCRIHAVHGYSEKPLSCQLYPFTLESDGDRIRVGVRFDCTSIVQNVGAALKRNRDDLQRLAGELKEELPNELTAATRHVYLTSARELTHPELDGLVERLDRWLAGQNRPLSDRLLGLHDLITVLSGMRSGKLAGAEMLELIDLLIADLPTAIEESRRQPLPAPTPRQLALFRRHVFACCENIDLEQARQGLWGRMRHRVGQYRRAKAMASGSGVVPAPAQRWNSSEPLRDATFDAVEAVRPDPQFNHRSVDRLLTRYLRTRLLTRSAFGSAYYNWPMAGGLAALLLAIAAAGWLTRWYAAAAGRDVYTLEDIEQALSIIDRSAGRGPELGAASAKLRIRYLLDEQGILRLLHRYSLA